MYLCVNGFESHIAGGMRLERLQRRVFEFVDEFCHQLKKLNTHDFIAKKQSNYFKEKKENLPENEIIVLMDFSENLAFEIQDAVQQHHYSKNQCTIFPVCIYFKENGELKNKSLIFIAESLKHDVAAVYLFKKKLIPYIKTFYGNRKILFFTDGAPSHFKNKKSFLNLCMFKKDYDIEAEWHFFATSHGKSPCDALGGSFKRNSRMENMKRGSDPLDTAEKLYNWAKSIEGSKVHFIFCKESEYLETEIFLNKTRFDKKLRTIDGTQSLHAFKPVTETKIDALKFSDSSESKVFKLRK